MKTIKGLGLVLGCVMLAAALCACGSAAGYVYTAARVAQGAGEIAASSKKIDEANQAKAEKFYADAQRSQQGGQLVMAEESIKKAIDIWPDHNQYRSFQGSLYYQMAMQKGGDQEYLKKSREAFVSCLGGNEKNSALHNQIAWNCFLIGDDPDEGLKYVSKAIEIEGRRPNYVGTKGCLNVQRGQVKEAISDLEEAVSALRGNNNNSTAINLYYLALAYQKSGDAVKSQAAFKEAVQLQPDGYYRKAVEPQLLKQ